MTMVRSRGMEAVEGRRKEWNCMHLRYTLLQLPWNKASIFLLKTLWFIGKHAFVNREMEYLFQVGFSAYVIQMLVYSIFSRNYRDLWGSRLGC